MGTAEPSAQVSLALEDPREAGATEMICELIAFLEQLYPEDEEEAPAPWTMETVARDGVFVVARVDGAAAGCGGLAPLAVPGALEIVRMYVRPDHRGRRIADRVLAELESLARARGVEALMLRCGPRQPEAMKLYERNGYVRRGVFAHHRAHPTNVFYEKRLEP
jgi:putative acetyltransferase